MSSLGNDAKTSNSTDLANIVIACHKQCSEKQEVLQMA